MNSLRRQWIEFAAKCLGPRMHPEQERQLRFAYYAGAEATLRVQRIAKPESVDAALLSELQTYAASVDHEVRYTALTIGRRPEFSGLWKRVRPMNRAKA